jgi:hypothetical protein
MAHTWPESTRFSDNEADVLGTFFHLAGQIESGGENQVRVCIANFIFEVEPLEVNLRSCDCLLASGHAFTQLDEFWRYQQGFKLMRKKRRDSYVG